MSTYTVTIDVADFVPNGVVPRLAFVTFSRLSVSDITGELVTTAPISVRVTQAPARQVLTAGVSYEVRCDGIPGVGTFYASASADVTFADLRESHQVDPATGASLPTYPTVGAQLAVMQAAVSAVQASVATLVQGAPGAYDTFLEVATQFGLDEATVTALQALVAGKASMLTIAGTVTS